MKRSTGFVLGGLAASLAFSPVALAQYSITVVDLMPPGAEYSEVRGIWGQHQVGYASFDSTNRAVLWSGTADSWVDLHPSGGGSSVGYAIADNRQAGLVRGHAAIWSGSAGSWVDLHPSGADSKSSSIRAMSSGHQAGGVGNHAATWTGTPDSFVDLHPTGVDESVANATTGSQQAGRTYHADLRAYHAALWSGTAVSWVDLHPTAATYEGYAPTGSEVSCAVDGLQAGWVYFEHPSFYRIHAGIWRGTAGSWLDLHPDGYDESGIYATTGMIHVGWTYEASSLTAGVHAALWLGNTSESVIDLNEIVRDTLGTLAGVETYANGVWTEGNTIHVVGNSTASGRPLLWTLVPFDGSGPAISEIPSQATPEDTPILDLPFTVSDPDTPLDELTFNVLSSNPALIAPEGVVVQGSGEIRTLDITPAPGRSGETFITLIVSDGAHEARRTFKVTVTRVNQPPTASPDTIDRRAGASVKVAVSRLLANDTDPDLDPLSLTAVASLSEKQAAVSLSGNWVLYVPPPGLNEPDTFTYTVSDGHGGEATGTVTVLITDDPAGPSLNQLALDVTRDPDTGEITGLTLTFVGIPGRLYALERAATLELPVTWTCLETQTAGPTGLMAFTDSQPMAGKAYYRTAERTTPCP